VGHGFVVGSQLRSKWGDLKEKIKQKSTATNTRADANEAHTRHPNQLASNFTVTLDRSMKRTRDHYVSFFFYFAAESKEKRQSRIDQFHAKLRAPLA